MDNGYQTIPVAGRVIAPGFRKDANHKTYKDGRGSKKKHRKGKDRRKGQERRKSVLDGVVVELSFEQDRRKGIDRRTLARPHIPPYNSNDGIIA